jgi:hypothetical protein
VSQRFDSVEDLGPVGGWVGGGGREGKKKGRGEGNNDSCSTYRSASSLPLAL